MRLMHGFCEYHCIQLLVVCNDCSTSRIGIKPWSISLSRSVSIKVPFALPVNALDQKPNYHIWNIDKILSITNIIMNKQTLFVASCLALTVTSMTFAIRAGILSQLGEDFQLNDTQLGWINSMAFLGFPIATVFGGLLYNSLGPKKLIVVAFFGHLLGLVLTIYATGFWGLLISTFFIGFANGAVEAGCKHRPVKICKHWHHHYFYLWRFA